MTTLSACAGREYSRIAVMDYFLVDDSGRGCTDEKYLTSNNAIIDTRLHHESQSYTLLNMSYRNVGQATEGSRVNNVSRLSLLKRSIENHV